MNIPECYDAVRQAERRELDLDRKESRRERCGCCGRIIGPGEWYFTVLRNAETFPLCRSCKDDVDESESLMEEVNPW